MVVVALLLVLALLVLTVALARVVRADGYGSRVPPASHHAWGNTSLDGSDDGWRDSSVPAAARR